MGPSKPVVPPLTHQNPVSNQDTPNHGVGFHPSLTVFGQLNGPPHPIFILQPKVVWAVGFPIRRDGEGTHGGLPP